MEIAEKVGALGCMLMNFESLEIQFDQLQLNVERIGAKAKVLEDKLSTVVSPFIKNENVLTWLNKQKELSKSFEEVHESFQRRRWFRLVNYVCLRRNIHFLKRYFDELSKSDDFTDYSREKKYEGEVQNLISYIGAQFKEWKSVVYEWLQSEIYICGVCGIGGIGKTALLEEVYFTIVNDERYRVCWVNVSKDFTITKLQDTIALTLKVHHLDGDGVERRVEFFKKLKLIENLVIILDNLCDGFHYMRWAFQLVKMGAK